jgi:protein-S-isoprenylcysteine O-methyltransferase Ste14
MPIARDVPATPCGAMRRIASSMVPLSPAVRSVAYTLVVPGSILVLIPWLTLAHWPNVHAIDVGAWRYLAIPLAAAGVGVYAWCLYAFTIATRRSPNMFSTPDALVAHGPYCYVRNPMYLSCLAIAAAEALWIPTNTTFAWAAELAVFLLVWVHAIEEPRLRRRLGEPYRRYCEAVPAWIPRLRPRWNNSPSLPVVQWIERVPPKR